MLVPYIGKLITRLIDRLGDGPYVIEVDKQQDDTDDLWKPGPNFVRRVVTRYYDTGLFLPFILLFLFAGIVPLQLLILLGWLIISVGTLFMLVFRDPSFAIVLTGYLALLYWASNYSVIK